MLAERRLDNQFGRTGREAGRIFGHARVYTRVLGKYFAYDQSGHVIVVVVELRAENLHHLSKYRRDDFPKITEQTNLKILRRLYDGGLSEPSDLRTRRTLDVTLELNGSSVWRVFRLQFLDESGSAHFVARFRF